MFVDHYPATDCRIGKADGKASHVQRGTARKDKACVKRVRPDLGRQRVARQQPQVGLDLAGQQVGGTRQLVGMARLVREFQLAVAEEIARNRLLGDDRLDPVDTFVEGAVQRNGTLHANTGRERAQIAGKPIIALAAVTARRLARDPAGVQYHHVGSRDRQRARRRQSGESAADDHHVGAGRYRTRRCPDKPRARIQPVGFELRHAGYISIRTLCDDYRRAIRHCPRL